MIRFPHAFERQKVRNVGLRSTITSNNHGAFFRSNDRQLFKKTTGVNIMKKLLSKILFVGNVAGLALAACGATTTDSSSDSASTASSTAATANVLKTIEENKQLRIVKRTYPPFSYRDRNRRLSRFRSGNCRSHCGRFRWNLSC